MEIVTCELPAVSVIGMEGEAKPGHNPAAALWEKANARFGEVEPLALRDENGAPVGVWGAMSDLSRQFLPWTDGFSRGLYMAGEQVPAQMEPPEGWTKWIIPGFAYLRVACDEEDIFPKTIQYLKENNIPLAGAVHDFTCPQTGKQYMCFPVRKL